MWLCECQLVFSVHIIVLVLVQIRSPRTELGSAQHRVVRLDIFRLEVNRVSCCLLGITIIVSIGNYRGRKPETLSRDCVNRKQAGGRIAWHITIVTPCVTRDGDAASRELREARTPGHPESQTRRLSKQRSVRVSAERRGRKARVTRQDFFVNISGIVTPSTVIQSRSKRGESRHYCFKILWKSFIFVSLLPTLILRLRWKGHYKKR